MKLEFIPSHKQSILKSLEEVRQHTLNLLTEVENHDTWFFNQAHPDFSPIGWHFGHIAFTEAYWILEYLGGMSPQYCQDQRLFATDGLPKPERQNLPAIAVVRDYLDQVRTQVLQYLTTAPLDTSERLWRWLIQHECQHVETITLISQLHQQRDRSLSLVGFSQSRSPQNQQLVKIEQGEFIMGSNNIEAQDNERPAHPVYLDTYWIDRNLITCGEYAQFMAGGGYQQAQYWSREGWQWLQANPVDRPLYWLDNFELCAHPVCGVNYYEAEAYANFVGKRLPTEAEWEKAARDVDPMAGNTNPDGCRQMLGHVWQWTTDWFSGYPSFVSYPYQGYSQVYFDGQHRVLKGGSWATRSPALRTSFRNWYYPQVRQILAGFRCATSDLQVGIAINKHL